MSIELNRNIVKNEDLVIEYYSTGESNSKSSLIISMGVWEPATRAFPLVTRLENRHTIIPSYRGRGGSSTPISGFDWHHHATDLDSILKNESLNKPVFLGFSKGVSYMLGYLSTSLIKPSGIIIIDYPAIHTISPKGYAEFWSNSYYNGFRLVEYVTKQTLEGIEKESTYKDFYEVLNNLNCPVWIFRGTDSTSKIPSNLTDEDISKYQASINNLEIIDFDYSGHMILDEELSKASHTINQILATLDNI
jgi:pimeloyl-ACP methyl ester carboxylesterase